MPRCPSELSCGSAGSTGLRALRQKQAQDLATLLVQHVEGADGICLHLHNRHQLGTCPLATVPLMRTVSRAS